MIIVDFLKNPNRKAYKKSLIHLIPFWVAYFVITRI